VILWWQIHNIAWVQDLGMGECLFWHMFNPPESYQSIGTIIPQGETTSQWSKWLIRLHLMTNQLILQNFAFWLQIAMRDLHQRVGHRRHRHGRRVGDPSIAWSGDTGQDKYDLSWKLTWNPEKWDPRYDSIIFYHNGNFMPVWAGISCELRVSEGCIGMWRHKRTFRLSRRPKCWTLKNGKSLRTIIRVSGMKNMHEISVK